MLEVLLTNPKTIWAVVSLLGLLSLVFSIVRAHFSKTNQFDLIRLFAYDSEGKMSDSKARLNAAFVVTTWAFVFLTMNDKLTEWYVLVFLTAWVGDRFAARQQSLKEKELALKSDDSSDK